MWPARCSALNWNGLTRSSRRARLRWISERLDGIEGIGFQPAADWASPAPWLFCITVDASTYGATRDELAAVLDRDGIETRPFFHPLHTLPPYVGAARGPLHVTERLAASGLNLPNVAALTDDDLDRVANAIGSARKASPVS